MTVTLTAADTKEETVRLHVEELLEELADALRLDWEATVASMPAGLLHDPMCCPIAYWLSFRLGWGVSVGTFSCSVLDEVQVLDVALPEIVIALRRMFDDGDLPGLVAA